LPVPAHDTVGVFGIWRVMVGVGSGLVPAVLSSHVVTPAPADAVAISSGLLNTARTVGVAVAGAFFAAVTAAVVTRLPGVAKPVTTEAGHMTVWLVCAVLVNTVAVPALRMDGRVRRRTVTVAWSGAHQPPAGSTAGCPFRLALPPS
jgi:hypothetical protein